MRRTRQKVLHRLHDAIIRTLVVLNFFSLVFLLSAIDGIISWQPYLIMAVNIGFLVLVALANGWIYGTRRYYERIGEKKDYEEVLCNE